MEGLSVVSDQQWLCSVPREKSPEEVHRAERVRDEKRGPYVPHHHHAYWAESRH